MVVADGRVGVACRLQLLGEEALHWHQCDNRVVRRVEMDLTGLSDSSALGHRLDALLGEAEAAEGDIVYVALRGRLARGVDFQPGPALRERFFHAVVDDSAVEPDYDIDLDAPLPEEPGLAATSEEIYCWRMHKRYLETSDEEERRCIKQALFYGLDALKLGEVHLR